MEISKNHSPIDKGSTPHQVTRDWERFTLGSSMSFSATNKMRCYTLNTSDDWTSSCKSTLYTFELIFSRISNGPIFLDLSLSYSSGGKRSRVSTATKSPTLNWTSLLWWSALILYFAVETSKLSWTCAWIEEICATKSTVWLWSRVGRHQDQHTHSFRYILNIFTTKIKYLI